MHSERIRSAHLSRIAYVYIRQSTQYQAQHNLESQARQYKLVDRAKAMGFTDVRVIDEDLGISAGLGSERSGFQRLVAEVSLNKVGMVLGLEVSRFARNNRDWYHLLDLCALFDTLLADQDGVYHPGQPNDRMVLGMRGTISEVEISLMKSRMLEGARNKAQRGEMLYRLAVGLVKTQEGKIDKDPNRRVQETIEQVFRKFRECQSIRQTFLWFTQEGIDFPCRVYTGRDSELVWKKPVYNTIHHVLTNPFYAGAYVYGRRGDVKKLKGDKITKHRRVLQMKDWKVLIKDHHPGYISWDEFEQNHAMIAENAKKMGGGRRGPVLRGQSLLAGLLRCKRCGRKLHVAYGGKDGKVPQYSCKVARLMRGEKDCISFGGMRLDAAVAGEVLRVVEPFAIEASMRSIEEYNKGIEDQRKLVALELENAQYEAERAYRQYNRVDPENRLVCSQLEATWDRSLKKVEAIKGRLESLDEKIQPLSKHHYGQLQQLAVDVPALWNAASTTNEMRKKVIRTVVEEILCDVDLDSYMIVLDIHWVGGVHTTLRVKKNRTGEHRACTEESTVELIRKLAKQLPDKQMAPVLNRLKVKTGKGNSWTRDRIRVLRHRCKIPAYDARQGKDFLVLSEASEKLGICAQSVRELIKRQIISAEQAVPCAPWMIPAEQLEKEEVIHAAERIRTRANRRKGHPQCENQAELFL